MEDCVHHECAVFGAIGGRVCPQETLFGLRALQHRGQDHMGLAVMGYFYTRVFKRAGLVASWMFTKVFQRLFSTIAIGHTRYATAGAATLNNAQPHRSLNGKMALCANGDIVPDSYRHWKSIVNQKGFRTLTDNDGELLLRIVEWQLSEGKNIVGAIRFLQENVNGAFSGLLVMKATLIAFRDSHGFRPLSIGQRPDGTGFLIASEDCALIQLHATNIEDIKPGEIRICNLNSKTIVHPWPETSTKQASCIFENIYFGHALSTQFGLPNGPTRESFGALLAPSVPADVDMVVAVPDSGNDAASALAWAIGKPLRFGVRRMHHFGRSFTAPTQSERIVIAEGKLAPDANIFSGKKVVLVDDSIVRGTTLKVLVTKLFELGALEVHVRIYSPPVTNPCFYGIATPTHQELIGANKSVDEINEYIGATSLVYLTVDDLKTVIRAHGQDDNHFCFACFNGRYPTPVPNSPP